MINAGLDKKPGDPELKKQLEVLYKEVEFNLDGRNKKILENWDKKVKKSVKTINRNAIKKKLFLFLSLRYKAIEIGAVIPRKKENI